jgi:hypothetical protein
MMEVLSTILLGIVAGVLGGALGQSGAEVMLPGYCLQYCLLFLSLRLLNITNEVKLE